MFKRGAKKVIEQQSSFAENAKKLCLICALLVLFLAKQYKDIHE